MMGHCSTCIFEVNNDARSNIAIEFSEFFIHVRNLKSEFKCLLTGTPSVQTVGTKVGTPVSLTGQRFTVQIPSSQVASVKSGR